MLLYAYEIFVECRYIGLAPIFFRFEKLPNLGKIYTEMKSKNKVYRISVTLNIISFLKLLNKIIN